MNNVKVGNIYTPNQGGSCVVIEKTSTYKSLIRFSDGYEYEVRDSDLERGMVKNPFYPVYEGVGYIGVGKHRTHGSKLEKKIHRMWAGAIERCYGNYENRYSSYKNCTVHPNWHNFQNFADWCYQQKNIMLDYELDKDLLVKGNKIYSSENCCLLPRAINQALCTFYSKNSNLKAGVSVRGNGRYRAKISKKGVPKLLGTFNSEEEAFSAYVKEKEVFIKELAEEYKESLEEKAYKALLNWKLQT